jgi:hypothetical protein
MTTTVIFNAGDEPRTEYVDNYDLYDLRMDRGEGITYVIEDYGGYAVIRREVQFDEPVDTIPPELVTLKDQKVSGVELGFPQVESIEHVTSAQKDYSAPLKETSI